MQRRTEVYIVYYTRHFKRFKQGNMNRKIDLVMIMKFSFSLVPVRGDLHILIVGDPGLGKSQMLQAVHQVS